MMLANLIALLPLFALPALSAPAQQPTTSAAPHPYRPVEFTNSYPQIVCLGDKADFSWTGGSTQYDVTLELKTPNGIDRTTIQDNTKSTHQEYTYSGSLPASYEITVSDVIRPEARDHFQETGWIVVQECSETA